MVLKYQILFTCICDSHCSLTLARSLYIVVLSGASSYLRSVIVVVVALPIFFNRARCLLHCLAGTAGNPP